MNQKKADVLYFLHKMKKPLLTMLITFLFFSCSEKKITIPENVLDEKEMTSILSDIHIAQAAKNNSNMTDSSGYTMSEYTNAILKNHNSTKDKFLSSLQFYSDNPEILQQVYDSVITSLSRIEAASEK